MYGEPRRCCSWVVFALALSVCWWFWSIKSDNDKVLKRKKSRIFYPIGVIVGYGIRNTFISKRMTTNRFTITWICNPISIIVPVPIFHGMEETARRTIIHVYMTNGIRQPGFFVKGILAFSFAIQMKQAYVCTCFVFFRYYNNII